MTRIILYITTLLIVGAATAGVLQAGASLPAPAMLDAQPQVAAAVHTSSQWLAGLQDNLSEPLIRLFVQLLTIIAAARLMGSLFARMGLPAVVGEMAAGVLLGPSLLGLLVPEMFALVFPADSLGTLRLLSQIGICFFMFVIGMELNVKHLRSRAQSAVAVSHASIVVPFLFGVMLAYFLFTELAGPRATFTGFALFMGISMSITAFPVLARILQERGMSRTSLGSTAITCAAVGDMTAWIIMAFVVAIARSNSMSGSVVTVVLALLFIVIMCFGVRRVLPGWLGNERLNQDEPSGGTMAAVMCIVLASALTTEVIGIHALFGAFLAGAVMPDGEAFRRRITAQIEKFSSVLLLPLFFAFTGLRTQIGLLDDLQGWLLCLLIIVVATCGKLGGSALAARMTDMSWRESLQLGALMNTRGLMELIALNIGYDIGILSPRIFTMLVIMALVTTLLTGPLLTLFADKRAAASEHQEVSRA